eukprot:Skav208488  [mRNA]  locus=scaffold87:119383:128359:+ [translate_table: standard]
MHPSNFHLLILRILILYKDTGIGRPLTCQQRKINLHLCGRMVVESRHLLTHGLQPFPQALHLGVQLLRCVGHDFNAVIQSHMALLLDFWELRELDPDVVLFHGLLKPFRMGQKRFLRDLLVLGGIENGLKTCDPVVELEFIFAGEIQRL